MDSTALDTLSEINNALVEYLRYLLEKNDLDAWSKHDDEKTYT